MTDPVFIYEPIRRPILSPDADPVVEYARLQREMLEAICKRISASQCGEAFEGLDTDCRSS